MRTSSPYFTIGISLKMYFGHAQAIRWANAIGEIVADHPAVARGVAEVFVVPSFPSLAPVRDALAGSGVRLGAQDLSWADSGAFTGEVSGAELAEIGCALVEIGHAERRLLFHEDENIIAAKTAAALRNGLTPLLCVGEQEQESVPVAARKVISQLDSALTATASAGLSGPLLVAYEPQWAIGAPEPASAEHISAVVASLEKHLAGLSAHVKSRVIYGGSAGPGLLTTLGGAVRGLFLGRFAHDPAAVRLILDEANALAGGSLIAPRAG
ncbi:triose-phosphate isomerase family protein [Mycetocola miduiensis]|uniref:Triosephosphate isomerase n=1 Tax=Mycetocola miduiensis TaxID=995034 RepID=A0A1I4ZJZ3_9MICO|nr:triosephosphate isomerase [Mycetocola miduiensis]